MSVSVTNNKVLLGALALLGTTPILAQVNKFANEPGWTWQVEPMPASTGTASTGGLVLMLRELRNGDALLTIAYSDQAIPEVFSFRGVAFDNSNRRYDFDQPTGGASNGVSLEAFRLPASRLTYGHLNRFGIEKLTHDSLHWVISPKAVQKLKDRGEFALNYPVIGKPYPFLLKTIDGTLIRSGDLIGKVVLLDFWASWCTPCMAKMPKLRRIYQELKDSGFVVIGINHDNTLESAHRIISKENLPWPEVVAPIGKNEREWWNVAAGISSLPRLWLIDRRGILKSDVSVSELEGTIRSMVSE